MASVSLTTVIVAHDSLAELRRTLPALMAELLPGDELIVVDNASRDGLAGELGQIAPGARLLRLDRNAGFAGGVNAGAAIASGELLVLLNPDARVQRGWGAAIRRPWGGSWGAWMGLVLMDDGRRINTSGGVLHFTGFGWAGQVEEPVERAPAAPQEVGFLSGACLAIPRWHWNELGGFPEHFFMYCEDVDLTLRLRLSGVTCAVVPDARVEHDYSFAKGPGKWRMLERNRWATVLRCYPMPLLVAVAPALAATELAVWMIAIRDGWGQMKLRAAADVARSWPRLLVERRAVQSSVRISARELAAPMTAILDSPYFGRVGTQPLLRRGLTAYWRAVMWSLRRLERRLPSHAA